MPHTGDRRRERRPAVAWIPTSRDFRIGSARLRAVLPCRYLSKAGWNCELFDLRRSREYDLVVFQKAYDDDAIELARRLQRRGTLTVLDLCDNHLYNPDGLPWLTERAERLKRMIDLVDAVTVSTEALADFIPDRDATVIREALDEMAPKPVPVALWRLRQLYAPRPFRLVWYGNAGLESPPFGLVHLPKVLPVLEELHRRRPLELTVISNSRDAFERAVAGACFPTGYHEWRSENFASLFVRHDVCIIPVEPNPFTICKTANRVALALKLGVPVVADPIPSFEEFADFMLLGNWPESLDRYAGDPQLRTAHVRSGRRYVEATCSKGRVIAEWSALFERLLWEADGSPAAKE